MNFEGIAKSDAPIRHREDSLKAEGQIYSTENYI